MSDNFELFVKSISGKSRTVVGNATTTIREIKEQIREKEGVSVEESRLIYGGKNLEDTRTLGDYNLISNTTIHMVLRVQGGAIVERSSKDEEIDVPEDVTILLKWN